VVGGKKYVKYVCEESSVAEGSVAEDLLRPVEPWLVTWEIGAFLEAAKNFVPWGS
jgi:ABC-type uncharacterized transport system permease subunit